MAAAHHLPHARAGLFAGDHQGVEVADVPGRRRAGGGRSGDGLRGGEAGQGGQQGENDEGTAHPWRSRAGEGLGGSRIVAVPRSLLCTHV